MDDGQNVVSSWLEKRLFDGSHNPLPPDVRMKVETEWPCDAQRIVDRMFSISPQYCRDHTVEDLKSSRTIIEKYLKRDRLQDEEWKSDVAIELKTLVPPSSWIFSKDSYISLFLTLCKTAVKDSMVCLFPMW